MAKQKHIIGEIMHAHVRKALASFPVVFTKKELIKHCEAYVSSNPEIYITPGWFARWMMDDRKLLNKHSKTKGSKEIIWVNIYLKDITDPDWRFKQF